MIQEPFAVEQFMDKYETAATYNMGETCVSSLSIDDILWFSHTSASDFTNKLLNLKLTYGHITGSPELKLAICKLYESVVPQNVVITNGAIGGNFLSLYSIVEPNDTVIVIQPTYQQLASVPAMFGAKVVTYDLQFERGFLPVIEELHDLIGIHSPKLLIFNNPNNPSGVVANDDFMKSLVQLCYNHNIYLLCDEVYRPLYHGLSEKEKPKSALDYGYEKVIVTCSMSKAFSLAGIRLGWIASNDSDIINDLLLKRDYNTISISMLDDYVATLALKNYQAILDRNYEICRLNLLKIEVFIKKYPEIFSWVKPNGGSTCFIKMNSINTQEFCETMAEKYETLIVPGEVFNRPGFIRVGFGNSPQDIESGLQQIERWLQSRDKDVQK